VAGSVRWDGDATTQSVSQAISQAIPGQRCIRCIKTQGEGRPLRSPGGGRERVGLTFFPYTRGLTFKLSAVMYMFCSFMDGVSNEKYFVDYLSMSIVW
jgi:hypothetical protein